MIATCGRKCVSEKQLSNSPRRVLVFLRQAQLVLDPVNDSIIQSATPYPETLSSIASIDAGVDPESEKLTLWAVGGGEGEEAAGSGLFLSRDEGASWEEVTPTPQADPGGQAAVSFSSIGTSRQDARTAYATCDRWMDENRRGERGHWYGVLKTTDSGRTWGWVYRAGGGSSDYTQRDGVEAENVSDSWVREAFAGVYIRMLGMGVYAGDPNIAVFTDWYRAMLTVDGGATWKALYSETLADGSIRSRGLDVTTSYGVHFDPFDENHIAISYTDIGYFHLGYDFSWGHRVVPDPLDPDMTTFGGSFFHGAIRGVPVE
jgi:hypothetical protein